MGRQLFGSDADEEWLTSSNRPGRRLRYLLRGGKDSPQVHVVDMEPGNTIPPHKHTEIQWQILVEGSCTIDGKQLKPYAVMYTDKDTEYGPIVADEEGATLLTVRPRQAGIEYTEEDPTDRDADPA